MNRTETVTSIVPAQPGWFVLRHNSELDPDGTLFHWKEPVIAWAVFVTTVPSEHPPGAREPDSGYASPITHTGLQVEVGYLLKPDGQVERVEDQDWPNVDRWAAAMLAKVKAAAKKP
jgi:hypothetical protein